MKIYKLIMLSLGFLISTSLIGQTESGYGLKSNSTESGYENLDAMGGPKTIGAQLKLDNQKKESFFRVPVRVTQPWYDWKARLHEQTGIQLGINYTSVYMTASDVIDESVNNKNTGSGILDIQLAWNLVGRKSGKNKGTLFLKINNRHAYGSLTNSMFHGIFESGYYGLPAVGFNDYSTRILELNWQQGFMDNKIQFVVGKVDMTNYFNFHGLVIPWSSFLGYGSSLSGTVNWPNQGIGIIGSYRFNDNWYAMGALADAYGDDFSMNNFLDLGDQFFDGNMFKAVEVGYVGSMAERYFKKISLTYWSTDGYTRNGIDVASSNGIAFTSHWFFQDKFAPYFRFAFSEGNGENAFYKKDVQIGHGFVMRSHDLLGTSFSWAETNIPGSKDQMTVEVYYRVQITERLAITPDFQWILNPTLNPNVNSLTYIGVRGRVTF